MRTLTCSGRRLPAMPCLKFRARSVVWLKVLTRDEVAGEASRASVMAFDTNGEGFQQTD